MVARVGRSAVSGSIRTQGLRTDSRGGLCHGCRQHCRRAGCQRLVGAALASVMLAIAAIDAHRFIIPDSLNAAGLTFGFLHAVLQADGDLMSALVTVTLRAAMLALSFRMSTCGCDYAKALASATSSLRLRRRLGWSAMVIAGEIAAASALGAYALQQYVLRTAKLPFGLFLASAIRLDGGIPLRRRARPRRSERSRHQVA